MFSATKKDLTLHKNFSDERGHASDAHKRGDPIEVIQCSQQECKNAISLSFLQ